jgi:hypothetical protein
MGAIPRSVRRAAQAEAARHGLTASIAHTGGKHPKLTLTNGDQWRRQPISGSPRSDQHNQADWVRQQVRRMARTMGLNK